MKYIVVKSPWRNLPAGTEIVSTSPRESATEKRGRWFKRKDGKLIFDSEPDGKFKLFNGEYEAINDEK